MESKDETQSASPEIPGDTGYADNDEVWVPTFFPDADGNRLMVRVPVLTLRPGEVEQVRTFLNRCRFGVIHCARSQAGGCDDEQQGKVQGQATVQGGSGDSPEAPPTDGHTIETRQEGQVSAETEIGVVKHA